MSRPALAALLLGCLILPSDPTAGVRAASLGCSDQAGVRQLSYVVNSRDAGFQCLGITVSAGIITAVRIENHFRGRAEPDVRISDFPVALIESDHGAVLDGQPGHDAIILQGRFNRPSTAAALMIRYLYNGITNEYRQCAISIDRGPEGEWRLLNARRETVSRIAVETRALPVVGVIGIATLEGACAVP